MVLLALSMGLRAQQVQTGEERKVVQARSAEQLRSIAQAIKNCVRDLKPTDNNGDWYLERDYDNVVWEWLPKAYIDFMVTEHCSANHVQTDEVCKVKDEKCERRNRAARNSWTSGLNDCERQTQLLEPRYYRYEFSDGDDGLESVHVLTRSRADAYADLRRQSPAETGWTRTELGTDCTADAVLAVVDDPLKGSVCPPDIRETIWCEAARTATRGNASIIYEIGRSYAIGWTGFRTSDTEAVRWYRKAAQLWDSNALVSLGDSYLNGKGVVQDDVAAARWYSRAAEFENPVAQVMLGKLYSMGRGVAKDDEESYFWLCVGASTLDDEARKLRDGISAILTPAQRLEVQQRCRKWMEEHSRRD